MRYILLISIFLSCVQTQELPEVAQKDGLDSDQKCEKNSQRSARSLASSLNCSDFKSYECDIRSFSPEKNDKVEKDLEYCLGGHCLNYSLYHFDTSSALEDDKLAEDKDFEKGGQYNYDEVSCWHKSNQLIIGDGDSIDLALQMAIDSCLLKEDK